MRRKILGNMCMIAVISILITSFLVIGVIYNDFVQQMRHEVTNESEYLKTALEMIGNDYLQELPKESSQSNRNRITLVQEDGTVIFDNYYSPESLENHAKRPEIQGARETGIGKSTRISDTLKKQTYYYAVKLQNGTILRIANTSNSVFTSVVHVIPVVLLVCAAVFILIFWIATKQTKKIVQPINELDFEHPKDTDYDELAPFLTRIEKQNKTIQLQIEELKVKQREFTALTENMSEGFLVVDNQGKVLSYNTSALDLLGIHQAVRERPNILTFNRSIGLQEVVKAVLQGKKSEKEMKIGSRYCQVMANPVTSRGEIKGAVLVIMDVTEKQQREQMRREFSANVSHELKTPLTSISGYAEIIKNGMVKEEDIPRFADTIYQESARLISMVGDIIKLSQLDEEVLELGHEQVDLYELSQAVLGHLQSVAKKHQVTLSIEGTTAHINGICQILEEMIHNLCLNAILYNHEGGSVKVRVEETKTETVVSVEDTGMGIPAQEQERVFERFYRVDKSHSKQVGGTGLGLSIVKHGAQFHGAKVSMESTVDIGTKVSIIWEK